MYPTKLVPIMNTCLFGSVKNAAIDLDMEEQVVATSQLYSSSNDFLAASTDITWDDTIWTDYLTEIDAWKLRPSTLTFTVMADETDMT